MCDADPEGGHIGLPGTSRGTWGPPEVNQHVAPVGGWQNPA